MRARRTRSETGFLRQRQIFTNLAGYLTKRLPNEWNSLGQGNLAVVVGAGPSLDITLTLLNSNIPKPIIVAADSSLKALKSAGMDPDFVISIDPQKTFDSCSDPDYTPGIAILSSQSHDSWRKRWGENCAYLSGRVITEDWLAEKGVSKTNHLAINNAGLSALAFADFLNTSAIITIGLDLAGGGDVKTGMLKIQTDPIFKFKHLITIAFLVIMTKLSRLLFFLTGKKLPTTAKRSQVIKP
jgi:hypothetical protein